jgi:hypothetical protein
MGANTLFQTQKRFQTPCANLWCFLRKELFLISKIACFLWLFGYASFSEPVTGQPLRDA